LFISKEAKLEVLPKTYQSNQFVNEEEFSIRKLKQLHINNTNQIESINKKLLIHTGNSTLTYIAIAAIIIILWMRKNNGTVQVINKPDNPPAVIVQQPITSQRKFTGCRI
jgi:hypothetical protein